jgi:hypothetical protein
MRQQNVLLQELPSGQCWKWRRCHGSDQHGEFFKGSCDSQTVGNNHLVRAIGGRQPTASVHGRENYYLKVRCGVDGLGAHNLPRPSGHLWNARWFRTNEASRLAKIHREHENTTFNPSQSNIATRHYTKRRLSHNKMPGILKEFKRPCWTLHI